MANLLLDVRQRAEYLVLRLITALGSMSRPGSGGCSPRMAGASGGRWTI
jgi:hypothetical protein